MFKKLSFYFFTIIILISLIEIFLFFFLNYQWNSKPRPLGENNEVSKYYKNFHPLFKNNSNLYKPIIIQNDYLPYSLGPKSYLYRNYGNGKETLIKTDELNFVHNGDQNYNFKFLEKKKDNEKRILFVGGSTTFGTGASKNENTYPAQVGKIINSKFKNKHNFLFLNAGVLGFNTQAEHVYLKKYLLDLQPDLIIFLDGSNDAHLSLIQKEFDKNYHKMEISKTRKNMFSFPQKLLLLNLCNRVYIKIQEIINSYNFKNKILKSHYHKKAGDIMKKNLKNTIDLLKKNNIKGIFYLQPNLFTKKNINLNDKILLERLEIKRPGFKKNFLLHYNDFKKVYNQLRDENRNNSGIVIRDISNLIETKNNLKFNYVSWAHFDDIGYNSLAKIISLDIEKILYLNSN